MATKYKARSKREQLLDSIRIHTAKGDDGLAMRVYVESRTVGFEAYNKARKEGLRIRSKMELVPSPVEVQTEGA